MYECVHHDYAYTCCLQVLWDNGHAKAAIFGSFCWPSYQDTLDKTLESLAASFRFGPWIITVDTVDTVAGSRWTCALGQQAAEHYTEVARDSGLSGRAPLSRCEQRSKFVVGVQTHLSPTHSSAWRQLAHVPAPGEARSEQTTETRIWSIAMIASECLSYIEVLFVI